MPARSAEFSEVARLGCRLVGVEGLRIEGEGEALDLLRGEVVRADLGQRSPTTISSKNLMTAAAEA